MIRKFVLSVLLFVSVVISGVCFGAENSDISSLKQKAVVQFGQKCIDRFEQMFQTGEFDFNYRSYMNTATIIHYTALLWRSMRSQIILRTGSRSQNWMKHTISGVEGLTLILKKIV